MIQLVSKWLILIQFHQAWLKITQHCWAPLKIAQLILTQLDLKSPHLDSKLLDSKWLNCIYLDSIQLDSKWLNTTQNYLTHLKTQTRIKTTQFNSKRLNSTIDSTRLNASWLKNDLTKMPQLDSTQLKTTQLDSKMTQLDPKMTQLESKWLNSFLTQFYNNNNRLNYIKNMETE